MKAELKYGKKVQIIKPKVFRSVYELHLDQEIIGTITFPKAMGTLAEAKFLDEEWTLKRVGFWKPYISVRQKGDETDLLQVSFSGGWHRMIGFTTREGFQYQLIQRGFWNPKWYWIRQDRQLMEFDVKFGLSHYAEVTILEKDALTGLILLIGSYGIIMQEMEDSSTTAGVTVAIG